MFAGLTVNENLRLAGRSVKTESYQTRYERVSRLFPQLTSYTKPIAFILRGGERQMLAMGIALIRSPEAILLDEPTAALAPNVATQVLDLISTLARDVGLCVVIAEQNAKRALEMGDAAYLLVTG